MLHIVIFKFLSVLAMLKKNTHGNILFLKKYFRGRFRNQNYLMAMPDSPEGSFFDL